MSFTFMLYMMGWGVIAPFMAIYIKQFVGSYTNLGLIYFLFYLTATIWCIPFGEFIDVASKKWSMMGILFLYIFIGPWFLLLNGFLSVVFLRIYHGMLSSSIWVTGDSYIREHSPKRKTAEAMGFFDSAYGLGVVLGSFLGGYLMNIFGFDMFISISISAALALFFVIFFLPDRKRKAHILKGLKAVTKTEFLTAEFSYFWSHKKLVKLSLLSFLLFKAAAILILLLPLFVFEMGEGYFYVGLIIGVFYIPKVFESVFSHLADKNSKKSIILIGTSYAVAFFLLIYFTESKLVLFILAFFVSLAFALIAPSIEGAITSIIPRKKIGEISGILRTVKLAAEGLGALIGGIISDIFGIQYVFLYGAFLMVVLFAVTLTIDEYEDDSTDNLQVLAQGQK